MTSQIPSQDEVLEYSQSLSNWGRWGPDDEIGTLNLISSTKRASAAALVTEGRSVNCARLLQFEDRAADVKYPPLHYMYRTGQSSEETSAADFIGISCHGLTVSHVDALSHQFWKGQLYNGKPQELINAPEGATVYSVDEMRDGIVTRGVLLDMTQIFDKPWLEVGEAIMPSHLEAAEREHGVTVEEGDALLVNTGWFRRREELGPHPVFRERPGLHASTLPWLRERGVAVVGGDAAQDVVPSGYPDVHMPLHNIGVTAMGLCLLDNLQFEDVIPVCRSLSRWSFMFVVAPLRIRYGTGSPATPLAIF